MISQARVLLLLVVVETIWRRGPSLLTAEYPSQLSVLGRASARFHGRRFHPIDESPGAAGETTLRPAPPPRLWTPYTYA
jgi:hypothetical protein